jgi:hypothetical protein
VKARRAGAWSPLSAEARALIAQGERDGLAWGYVRLACGEAAQQCAFGVAARSPDLLPIVEGGPVDKPDRDQADFGF